MPIKEWLTTLHENGYRVTKARGAVVNALQRSSHAVTPLEVFDKARAEYRALGLVTVYRTIEKLEELGLIQRVHQSEGCQAFISAGEGHQHLLLCRKCGETAFFEGDDLDALIRSISKKTGFLINDHWLQFFGLCAKCKPS